MKGLNQGGRETGLSGGIKAYFGIYVVVLDAYGEDTWTSC